MRSDCNTCCATSSFPAITKLQAISVVMYFVQMCNSFIMQVIEWHSRTPSQKVSDILTNVHYTVRSESRCALRLRYVDLTVSIDASGHHFQHVL
jgi:hypothetical protein